MLHARFIRQICSRTEVSQDTRGHGQRSPPLALLRSWAPMPNSTPRPPQVIKTGSYYHSTTELFNSRLRWGRRRPWFSIVVPQHQNTLFQESYLLHHGSEPRLLALVRQTRLEVLYAVPCRCIRRSPQPFDQHVLAQLHSRGKNCCGCWWDRPAFLRLRCLCCIATSCSCRRSWGYHCFVRFTLRGGLGHHWHSQSHRTGSTTIRSRGLRTGSTARSR